MKNIIWALIPLVTGAYILLASTSAVKGVIEGLSLALGAK